jgi:hypothetical protein
MLISPPTYFSTTTRQPNAQSRLKLEDKFSEIEALEEELIVHMTSPPFSSVGILRSSGSSSKRKSVTFADQVRDYHINI